jgi:NAD(P)H-quinone oxidoreductase subunit 5
MEGPTPSSAVYYGSLSVHAGCFLLLRATPLLEHSWIARVMIGTAGLCTALYATFAGRTQADVKSVLAFATLTQIGVIILEISLGLSAVAFAHLTGHALFRLLQFLTAPNVIHEFHQLENVSGGHLGATGRHLERLVPQTWQPRLYRFALDRAGLDEVLERFVVAPIYSLAHALDRLDRSACGLLAGRLRIFQPRQPERKS